MKKWYGKGSPLSKKQVSNVLSVIGNMSNNLFGDNFGTIPLEFVRTFADGDLQDSYAYVYPDQTKPFRQQKGRTVHLTGRYFVLPPETRAKSLVHEASHLGGAVFDYGYYSGVDKNGEPVYARAGDTPSDRRTPFTLTVEESLLNGSTYEHFIAELGSKSIQWYKY